MSTFNINRAADNIAIHHADMAAAVIKEFPDSAQEILNEVAERLWESAKTALVILKSHNAPEADIESFLARTTETYGNRLQMHMLSAQGSA